MTDRNLMHAITALFAVGFIVYGCALFRDSRDPAIEAATCSPKADVWHQVELARVCGKKLTTECPEAAELRARYLELEAAECSKTQ